MRTRLIALAGLLALSAPGSAEAAATQLAPSFGYCGTGQRGSESTLPGGPVGRASATCDRQTGAVTLFGEDPGIATDLTSTGAANAHFYARDQVAEGTKHRRYTVRVEVAEAWVRTLVPGVGGPEIGVFIAALPLDCFAECTSPSATKTIVGGPLGTSRVTNSEVTLILDWVPNTTEIETETIPAGYVSLLIGIGGRTPVASVGPSSFSAAISSIHVSAETLA